MDLDFSLLTFSPSIIKKTSKPGANKKYSKLAKSRQINNEHTTNEKEWTPSNLNSTKITSKCISNGDKTSCNKLRVNKGKENRFNKCMDLASDQQDLVLHKIVSKVRPLLSTEFSPSSAKKKRLIEKESPKQMSGFLERLKTIKSDSSMKKISSSNSPVIIEELRGGDMQDLYGARTNNENDVVIVISDSGSDSSDIVESSPKTHFRSPWSANLTKKNVLHKGIVLESSDTESEVFDKIQLNLHTPMTNVQTHTSNNQIHLPLNSTPLFPTKALSSQSKYKNVQNWISKIPSLTDLDQTSDIYDLCNNGVQENNTDNVEWSTSTEDLLKKLYGPSLPPNVLNFKTPRTEPLKKEYQKLIRSDIEHTECVKKKQIQDRSLNSTKSEDFEKFLKNVHHNFESTNQNLRNDEDFVSFIDDEEEDDSITFYQNLFNNNRNDLKKNKISSDSSDNSSKKQCITIKSRKLIFSSSDDDTSERKKNSSDDSESKVKTRREKNTKSSESNNNRSVTITRRNKYVDSVDSKKTSSNSELKVRTKKKNSIKRTPKVVSSPVKRIIRTAPKPLTHKKPSRLSLQSSPCSLQPSFLTSLSNNSNGNNHLEGLYYRNNFKKKKEELCTKLFKMYNRQVFDNKLPEGLLIEWNVRMKKTAGFCYNRRTLQSPGTRVRTSRIVLSTKVCDTAERLRDTLIHELCHAATWIVDDVKDGHGPRWKSWARRAMNAFPELPPIKRCHDYKIQTKFTYRCTRCGYSIGRHSKSLDIATKRCGLCFGMFELLVNERRKSGTIVQQSVKKRSPVGFARYVKENYNTVKTSQTNMKHADVMRLLGQQFSAVKIGAKKFV